MWLHKMATPTHLRMNSMRCETGNMEHDAIVKRAIFIGNSLEIREAFAFASPVEIFSAIKIYCCSFYGSMLWDLGGEGANQVFNSWTTGVRLTWSVPRATRTYLVLKVLDSGLTSSRVDILARFAGFFQSLRKSPSYEVAVLACLAGRDIRTTTGKNLKLLEELSGLDPWVFGSGRMKQELVKVETGDVPEKNLWRVPLSC